MSQFNRRFFLKTSVAGVAGFSLTASTSKASVPLTFDQDDNILTRTLGNTGIRVPVLSMGVGGCDSPAVVRAALKSGITHFDTAHVYQGGNSEKMLGSIFREYPRESFTVATKVKQTQTREEFLRIFDESLARLQLDYVDILYLHSIKNRNEALDPGIMAILSEIKNSGRARHIGLSTHSNEPEVIQAAIDSDFYEVVLVAYNFKQDHAEEVRQKIRLAGEKGIGIVAMKVMAGGYLDKEKTREVNYRAALKWVLQEEHVSTTIPSINNLDQLKDNMQVLRSVELTGEEMNALELAGPEQGLFCNQCNECTGSCGHSLPIPDAMRAYMYAYAYGQTLKAQELLNNTGLDPDVCSSCPVCTVTCRKGFAVHEKLTEILRLQSVPKEFLT